MAKLTVRIEGIDLPGGRCGPSPDRPDGYRGIHVAVQRRDRPAELLVLTPADATTATWSLDCDGVPTADGFDIKGPYIQGRPADRFIYLSWGEVDAAGGFEMFRRAKLLLGVIPTATVASALETGVLVGRVGLTDARGNPLCAAVRPPAIDWSAA
jgi:hypothetical protein